MAGREKIQAAFTKEGTHEFPAVLCYEDIYQWSLETADFMAVVVRTRAIIYLTQ